MWCPHCIREVTPSPGRSAPAVCPLCGRAVEAVTRQSQAVRQAREILERWQASDLFERITSSDVIPEHKTRTRETPARLPQPEQNRAISASMAPEIDSSPKTTSPPRLNPPPVIPPATQFSGRPVSRSVIRELPQLPFDLLAPTPVVAAAAETLDARPAAPATPTDIKTAPEPPQQVIAPKTDANPGSPADWEPPPRTSDLFSLENHPDAAAVTAKEPAEQAEQSVAVKLTAEPDSDAELAAFFESSALGFFSEPHDLQANKPSEEPQISQAEEHPSASVPESVPAPESASAPESVPADAHGPKISAAIEVPLATVLAESLQPAGHGVEPVVDSKITPTPPPDNQSAAAADESAAGPVILQAPPRRSRPALQRPPLVRRSPAPSETVPSFSGTIPMNRNQDAESAATGQPMPAAPAIVSNSPESGLRERRDSARTTVANPLQTPGWERSAQRYIDEPHGSGVRGPHFEVAPPPRSNMTTVIGQALAYIGVISLLIGTSLVILGHFGGESEYTPTGWLITTVAQMLLFLGIINLVSGGMEQHNDEVARRIYSLSEHLIRIEQTTAEALRASRQPEPAHQQEPVESVSAGDRKKA